MHKFISKKLQILHYILSVNLFAPPYQGRGPKTTAIFPMLPTTPKLAFGGRESVLGRLALLEVGSEGRPRIFLRFPPLNLSPSGAPQNYLSNDAGRIIEEEDDDYTISE